MSRRKHILGFGLLVAAATTVPAYAQSTSASNVPADFPVCTKTTISQGDGDLAKQKFIAARQDYEEGNYDSALRRFKDAYNLDCTKPEVLLIVASTYERKGDRQAAVAALETYMQRAPKDSPDIATTQAKIENLKKQIASQPPPPPTATTTAPANEEVREHTIYPWLVVAAGVTAVGIGIAVIVTTPALPDGCVEATQKCGLKGETPTQVQNDRDTAGRAAHQGTYGAITVVGGGVIIAGGILWHFLEPTGPKEKTAITPAIGPGFAGLSLRSAF